MSERFKPIKPLPEDSMGEKDPTEKMVEEAKKKTMILDMLKDRYE